VNRRRTEKRQRLDPVDYFSILTESQCERFVAQAWDHVTRIWVEARRRQPISEEKGSTAA
jgi:hypothetical protein